MKHRLNIFFDAEQIARLGEIAERQGISKSSIVVAAVASYLSPDALDRLSRQLEKLERDLAIAVETHALFVRFWLSVTTPVPASQQEAAKAQGTARYQSFIETLGRRLQRGDSLVREISAEIWPEKHARHAYASEEEIDDAGL